jgi:hypothetical protein
MLLLFAKCKNSTADRRLNVTYYNSRSLSTSWSVG